MILPNSGRRGPDSATPSRQPSLASAARITTLSASLLFCVTRPISADNAQTPGFPLRNYSPFTAIIGVPGRWPNGARNGSELAWNIASHSERESLENESLFLDGETHILTARVQRQLGERLQLGLEIPWVSHSGGFLDDAIDTWHDLTGLTEGIRPEVPSNEVSYVYGRGEDELFRLDDSASGIGDMRLGLAADLGSPLGDWPWQLVLNVDLPTGDADKLTGNGNTDLAAGLRVMSPVSIDGALSWALDLGVAWPGDVDIDGPDPSGQIFYYDAALAWRVWQPVDLLVQIAGHTAPYQSRLEMLGGPSAQIAAGILWHLSDHYGLRLGFTEDIHPETAPDFGLELTLVLKQWP